ncbi:chemotaxis protein CheV [Vibrio gazogenes]|uniref:Two-component system, chemotaxis family, response regulator CheV n=1 Tax=Vibrio gazogenes DSM 21264 = NBRC 103151 TaxID=1123492 RepID=A0A1M4X6E2_VIBGA|nr:chemotaxis protein CheV [Vibrio gazogenes]USP13004.1 chemotaxis protein CheV [Vibrio gazogenes]SHE89068.1 two-component system, chemotaxis family, response regulator CheV [Vibrio gazogenes DSM 21264] [Vibrio gazogenes DSM 21264 = NBRC 103151]SJN57311.1 Chemotaxis protein CheV [Vibrio gazogenes]
MTGILDSVNQRTQLVGQNRLELLTFRLNGRQRYGINVFKVKEVLQCPKLTAMPNLHRLVKGVAHIRGQTVSVIDLSLAIGGRATTDVEKSFVVIAEFNRTIQAFLVASVERIVNMRWEEILPPPEGAGKANYLTAVTNIENELVEIIDVEKILAEIAPIDETMDSTIAEDIAHAEEHKEQEFVRRILIADDSTVARKQVQRAVESIGFEVIAVKDGKEAYEKLVELSDTDNIFNHISLVISDIEMPEMDGYTLTAEIRRNPKLKDLYVILHSSLSGVFNQAMVERVGANTFIAKFNPDELGNAVKAALIDTELKRSE